MNKLTIELLNTTYIVVGKILYMNKGDKNVIS